MFKISEILTIIITSIILFFIHINNTILFHCIIGILSIIIAFNIFVIGWNSRHLAKNSLLILPTCAFLAVGIMDIYHMLTSSGLDIFVTAGVDVTNHFWLAARYIQSISILAGIILLIKNKKLNSNIIMSIYITIILFITIIIFHTDIFPACYNSDQNITTFKIISEYFICIINIISQIIIWRYKKKINMSKIFIISLVFSLEFTIFSEIFFVCYKSIKYALYWGQLFRLLSFYFIYKAFIKELLRKPYENLFKEYSNSQKKLIATSSMVSTMYHDIKNPLTNISALGQLGSKTSKSIKDKDYFLKINKYVNDINNMLNENLRVFDSEKMVEINPVKSLKEILIELRPLCRGNNIELNLDISHISHKVLIEENLFKRVIYNLVNNSVKAIKDKGKIDIKIEEKVNHILISVKDNGPGIPTDLRNDVFKPFRTGGKSSGLGLYMVKFTVNNMFNGEVWFKTHKNKGTIFYIKLPLINEHKTILTNKKNIASKT